MSCFRCSCCRGTWVICVSIVLSTFSCWVRWVRISCVRCGSRCRIRSILFWICVRISGGRFSSCFCCFFIFRVLSSVSCVFLLFTIVVLTLYRSILVVRICWVSVIVFSEGCICLLVIVLLSSSKSWFFLCSRWVGLRWWVRLSSVVCCIFVRCFCWRRSRVVWFLRCSCLFLSIITANVGWEVAWCSMLSCWSRRFWIEFRRCWSFIVIWGFWWRV